MFVSHTLGLAVQLLIFRENPGYETLSLQLQDFPDPADTGDINPVENLHGFYPRMTK